MIMSVTEVASGTKDETGITRTDTAERGITRGHAKVATETAETTDTARRTDTDTAPGAGVRREAGGTETSPEAHRERTMEEGDQGLLAGERTGSQRRIGGSDSTHHRKITKFQKYLLWTLLKWQQAWG